MVEQQIKIVVLPAHFQVILAPHEGEAYAHLHEKGADVLQQPALQMALLGVGAEGKEIKVVGVF